MQVRNIGPMAGDTGCNSNSWNERILERKRLYRAFNPALYFPRHHFLDNINLWGRLAQGGMSVLTDLKSYSLLFYLHSCGLPKNSILCGLHRARLLLLGGGNTEELGLVLLVLTPTIPSTVPQMIF